MLQARTEEQENEVLKILGLEEVCCHFPLNFGEVEEVGDLGIGFKSYNDRLYIDGDITFDQMAKVVDYLRKHGEQKPTDGVDAAKASEWSEASYKVGIQRVLDNPESYGLTKNLWKPSERQMWAIENAQMLLCGTEYNVAVCSLIEDLKKLK